MLLALPASFGLLVDPVLIPDHYRNRRHVPIAAVRLLDAGAGSRLIILPRVDREEITNRILKWGLTRYLLYQAHYILTRSIRA